jgi:NitT/TauT family transport system substrate-binding protein
LLVAKKDLAKHWGKSYEMEAVRYQGTPPMITALANGELEIANLAYSTLGLAIENAGISDLRVISDEFRDGVPGYFSNQFFVRKDSGIKKIEDLKGKVLATNSIGAGIDIAMKAGLKKHGLIDKRDFTVIEAPFPTMAAMLNDKKADLVSAVMPFALNPMLNQIGFPLYDQTEGLGPSQFVFWTARKAWIDKNRAAIVDFLEDHMLMRRWLVDPKTRMDAVKVLAEVTKQPVANYTDWAFTQKDTGYRAPDLLIDPARFQKNVDDLKNVGVLPMSIPVAPHIDLSLAKAAAARVTTN